MRGINDLKTRTKLLGAFLAVAAIIVGVAFVGYLDIQSVTAGAATMYADRLLPTQQLASFNDAQATIEADLYRLVLFPAERADRESEIAALVTSADASLKQYEGTYLVADETQGLARLKPAWAAYQQAVARTIELAKGGNDAQALGGLAAGGPVNKAGSTLRGIVNDLIAIQIRVGVGIREQGDLTFDRATWTMALTGLIGLLLAVGLAVLIGRSISVPLSRITGAARDVAAGRLDGSSLGDIRSRDEIGILANTFGFMTDRLRDAQGELRRSEERFRLVVESAMDAVITVDDDQRIETFSSAAEEMFGRTGGDVIGRSLDCLVPERFRDPHSERLLAFNPPEEPSGSIGRRFEIIGLRANGEEFPADASFSRLESGGRTFGTVILHDRSEEKRIHDALHESEERYRHITETITDYVFTVAVDHGAVARTIHGAGCIAVTGFTPEEFGADPWLWMKLVAPEDQAAVGEQARAALAAERFAAIEHRIIRKDGSERWVRNTPVPQLGPDGTLVAYDGLIQDITERRMLQQELLQAQKMESIGRLAGGVAHDFNNLLTVILGNAELARADLTANDPARPSVDEVINAGQRAASITRQLLAFASKQIMAPVRLDLNAVVADSEKMLRRLLGEDIEIVTELEPSLESVEADPGQIQQMLVNLAVNARDAMPQGGKLVIETANETANEDYAASHPEFAPWRYVRLSLTDNGVGMSAEVKEHLFEPFFTTKGPGKGTGLGLATCHGIVRQIGGQIRVHSEPGHGTTFQILLPAINGPATSTPEPSLAGSGPTGNEKILVVEDEPAVRRLAALVLRAQGYSVLEAADGFAALDLAKRTPDIDLIVSDVIMPGMNGPELIERLRQRSSVARVLLMSGHAEASILSKEVAAGGLAFLPKPFTPERLARKVREILDSAP